MGQIYLDSAPRIVCENCGRTGAPSERRGWCVCCLARLAQRPGLRRQADDRRVAIEEYLVVDDDGSGRSELEMPEPEAAGDCLECLEPEERARLETIRSLYDAGLSAGEVLEVLRSINAPDEPSEEQS